MLKNGVKNHGKKQYILLFTMLTKNKRLLKIIIKCLRNKNNYRLMSKKSLMNKSLKDPKRA